jgi:hypothetical protein
MELIEAVGYSFGVEMASKTDAQKDTSDASTRKCCKRRTLGLYLTPLVLILLHR